MTDNASRQSSADISILEVRTRRDMTRFIKLPGSIYEPGDNWIEPLHIERREHLSPKTNPFFEHGEAALFLAMRENQCVGRISAQICRLHLERHGDQTGFFGFIDAVDEREVFARLLRTAEDWLRDRGMKQIRGPFSFTINEETGLLIDGFDRPPAIFMGHAKPYYRHHIEALGYAKAKDIVAYDYHSSFELTGPAKSLCERAERVSNIVYRNIRLNEIDREIAIINDIFNDAWSDNWGFVPMTQAELKALAKNLKMLVRPISVKIAEIDGEPVAFGVTLPDLNAMISDLNGRLLPFGWAKLMWRIKMRRPNPVRLALMGVRKKYQRGLTGAALALGVIDTIRSSHSELGPTDAELSWILEDNKAMRRMIEMVGGKVYKTYRVYERAL